MIKQHRLTVTYPQLPRHYNWPSPSFNRPILAPILMPILQYNLPVVTGLKKDSADLEAILRRAQRSGDIQELKDEDTGISQMSRWRIQTCILPYKF